MNKIIILLSLMMVSFKTTDFSLVNSIPVNANTFKVDHLGNIYILKEGVLEKYDEQGKLFKTYTNKLLGSISFIDVSNPLKLILFYKNFSQIVFLDNMLSPKGNPVVMGEIGFQQPSLVCSSYNNGLWVFNLQNAELVRLDQNLQPGLKTGNIGQLLNMEINPNYLLEHNNMVYLNNPKVGILIFDIYGTYYKTIPLKGLQEFQLNTDHIFYYQDKKMMTFNLKTLDQNFIELPDTNSIAAAIEKGKLYLLRLNRLDVYSIR